MDLGIAGRWALVCGASKGLGWGCAQALAVVPGVSRSGVTIFAGLLLGLKRPAAARFSFLLAVPGIGEPHHGKTTPGQRQHASVQGRAADGAAGHLGGAAIPEPKPAKQR